MAQAITFSLQGFNEVQKAIEGFTDARHIGKVIKRSWSASARDTVKPKVRSHVARVFHGKRRLASSYSAHVTGNQPYNLRMDVTSRLKMAIPHEFGPAAPIFGKGGKMLAIPTRFAREISFAGQKGIKKRSSRVKLRTKHLNKSSTFVLNKGNKKIIMMKVDQETGSRTRSIQKKALRKAGSSIKGQTAIPLFVLQPSVVLPRRTRVRWKFRREILPIVAHRTARNLKQEFYRLAAGARGDRI